MDSYELRRMSIENAKLALNQAKGSVMNLAKEEVEPFATSPSQRRVNNSFLFNRDIIIHMERMRDWFRWIKEEENATGLEWRFRGRASAWFSTENIVYILNGMIGKYSIGCTMEDEDRDTLNLFREYYNRNRGKEFSSLITTI